MVMLLEDVKVFDFCRNYCNNASYWLRKGMKFKLVEKSKSMRRALLQVYPNMYGEYIGGWSLTGKKDNKRFWWVNNDIIDYQKLEI